MRVRKSGNVAEPRRESSGRCGSWQITALSRRRRTGLPGHRRQRSAAPGPPDVSIAQPWRTFRVHCSLPKAERPSKRRSVFNAFVSMPRKRRCVLPQRPRTTYKRPAGLARGGNPVRPRTRSPSHRASWRRGHVPMRVRHGPADENDLVTAIPRRPTSCGAPIPNADSSEISVTEMQLRTRPSASDPT
jgi:hypothetical protein